MAVAGPRRLLQDVLTADLVMDLERLGILRQGRVAFTFPCPGPRGNGCPRQIIEIDDEYHAVCGNSPAECDDLILSAADVAALALDPAALCRVIAQPLRIRAAPEELAEIRNVHRVGTFMPEPGDRHPVFLATRDHEQEYVAVLDALRLRCDGAPFAMLIPTDRCLGENLERSARAAGVSVVALADVLGFSGGGFIALGDPLRIFAGLGQRASVSGVEPAIVARALICRAGAKPSWFNLGQAPYEELLATADQYDVFADERGQTVRKKAEQVYENVRESYFRSILGAVTSAGRFDPVLHGPDMKVPKETFQRARPIFDLRASNGGWRIFPTEKTHERRAVYRFAPDPDVTFAFVFLPDE